MCGQKTPSASRALNPALRHVLAIKAANPETRRKPSTTAAMPPSPECVIKNEIGSQGTGYVSKEEVEAYLKSTFGTGKNFSIRVGWSFPMGIAANIQGQHLEERWVFWAPREVTWVGNPSSSPLSHRNVSLEEERRNCINVKITGGTKVSPFALMGGDHAFPPSSAVILYGSLIATCRIRRWP